jgi:hypothetical protein
MEPPPPQGVLTTMQTQRSIIYRWRFSPVAGTKDPRWDGRHVWHEVVVAAPTQDDAIRLADDFYRSQFTDSPANENRPGSGFDDVTLYDLDQRDEIDAPLAYASLMYARLKESRI